MRLPFTENCSTTLFRHQPMDQLHRLHCRPHGWSNSTKRSGILRFAPLLSISLWNQLRTHVLRSVHFYCFRTCVRQQGSALHQCDTEINLCGLRGHVRESTNERIQGPLVGPRREGVRQAVSDRHEKIKADVFDDTHAHIFRNANATGLHLAISSEKNEWKPWVLRRSTRPSSHADSDPSSYYDTNIYLYYISR